MQTLSSVGGKIPNITLYFSDKKINNIIVQDIHRIHTFLFCTKINCYSYLIRDRLDTKKRERERKKEIRITQILILQKNNKTCKKSNQLFSFKKDTSLLFIFLCVCK